jgi:hypothetical protein
MDALLAESSRLQAPHETAGLTRHARAMHQHFSYVARSEYDKQFARWFSVFPREQILCLKSERLFSEPGLVLEQVADFLGIGQFGEVAPKPLNQGEYDAAPPEVRHWLAKRLEKSMESTAELLGPEMTWR